MGTTASTDSAQAQAQAGPNLTAEQLRQQNITESHLHNCRLLSMLDEHTRSQEEGQDGGLLTPSCPRVWDSMACWPPTLPNQTAWLPCPDYIYNQQMHNIGGA
ncbi:hypothetical protein BV898_05643 [Hypsibius exemplaris]|uniref:G-protein coupled receptors family 2 profile 1 domain-containing protein n=1 Tax=Hypsibius exemplaris TaxID=2072580 RepID=A0A1W0WYS3_HYPEX|nr:hypothetical protein BV898_05643 [Hypsibius exemplaris]